MTIILRYNFKLLAPFVRLILSLFMISLETSPIQIRS